MTQFGFDALGTTWLVVVDQPIPVSLSSEVVKLVSNFEQQYSRFLPSSVLSQINQNQAQKYIVDANLQKMLSFGLQLSELTQGYYDLNIANLLEGFGYDSTYSFQSDSKKIKTKRGKYTLTDHLLKIKGKVKLDLGSLGKGYLVDLIAAYLSTQGLDHFLIDGGGDLYGTTKVDQSPWQTAIEHPFDSTQAIAKIDLHHQAIATSTSQKRKLPGFHHLLDPHSKKPISHIVSVSVIADSAFIADALSTALFVSPLKLWPPLIARFKLHYLAVFSDLSYDSNIPFLFPR